jgi:hypothetical protein
MNDEVLEMFLTKPFDYEHLEHQVSIRIAALKIQFLRWLKNYQPYEKI